MENNEDRKVNSREFEENKILWDKINYVKNKIAQDVINNSNSEINNHRLLVLVDLQGIYLSLYEWLSDINFPMNDGFIISRFAYYKIYRVFEEIEKR